MLIVIPLCENDYQESRGDRRHRVCLFVWMMDGWVDGWMNACTWNSRVAWQAASGAVSVPPPSSPSSPLSCLPLSLLPRRGVNHHTDHDHNKQTGEIE